MKVRNGFVSNSSSSSFVFIVDAEAHEKALSQIEDVDNILNCIFANSTKRKFGDRDVIIISGGDYESYNVKGNFSCYDVCEEEIQKAGHEELWEYWVEVVDKLWEDYKNCITNNNYIEEWEDH